MFPAIFAYLLPESIYINSWETPKYFDFKWLSISFLFCALFLLSSEFISPILMRVATKKTILLLGNNSNNKKFYLPLKLLKYSFNVTFYIAVSAYLLWWSVAVVRGLSIQNILGVLLGLPGAIYVVKRQYFETLSGLTTFTEVGIVFGIVSGILIATYSWKYVKNKYLILTFFILARVILHSERVALISLFAPTLISALGAYHRENYNNKLLFFVIQYFPVISIPLLLLFFSVTEYFRSWVNAYSDQSDSLILFAAVRLLGYYITAMNNSILYFDTVSILPFPYWTLQGFWEFPIIKSFYSYDQFTNLPVSDLFGAADGEGILGSSANSEFNNAAGIFLPILDFGLLGASCYWFLAGIIAGILFKSYSSSKLFGMILYPTVYTGILEVSRILFLHSTKAVIIFASSFIVLFIYYYQPTRNKYGKLI